MMRDNFNQPDVFQGDLQADEKVLWKGQPDRSVIFNRSDIFILPFGLIWLGIVFHSMYMYYVHGVMDATVSVNGTVVAAQQSAMLINAAIMVVIGLLMTVGRLAARNIYKRYAYYAVTNKRILFVTKFFGKRLKSEYINTLPGMDKKIKKSGIGTISFDCISDRKSYGNRFSTRFTGLPPSSFCDIQDANNVYQTISKLRNSN